MAEPVEGLPYQRQEPLEQVGGEGVAFGAYGDLLVVPDRLVSALECWKRGHVRKAGTAEWTDEMRDGERSHAMHVPV